MRHLVDELATPQSTAYAPRITRLCYYNFCNPSPPPPDRPKMEDTGLIAPPYTSDNPLGCLGQAPREAYNVFKGFTTSSTTATP